MIYEMHKYTTNVVGFLKMTKGNSMEHSHFSICGTEVTNHVHEKTTKLNLDKYFKTLFHLFYGSCIQ